MAKKKSENYLDFIPVIKRINGERTVGQLAQQLKEQFGDQAEPLYDRLVKYMQILRNNEFILFRGKDKVKE